jgi:lipopolysaccharide biosynthesis protein
MPVGSVRRVALFAHYDVDGIIDDYVLYALAGLRNVVEEILFVSDSVLSEQEVAKLNGLATFVCCGSHGEYDFGSWKRGWNYLGDKVDLLDEIVLLNDSCYAPVFPFAEAFDAMSDSDCDFWGQTASGGMPGSRFSLHLDSYFFVLRKQVISDGLVDTFFMGVGALDCKDSIIEKFEVGFSQLLVNSGYRLGSFVARSAEYQAESPDFLRSNQVSKRCPCLKVKVFRDNQRHSIRRVPDLVEELSEFYPVELIIDHCLRVGGRYDLRHWFLKYPYFKKNLYSSWFIRLRGRYVGNYHFWLFYVTLLKLPIFVFVWPTLCDHRASLLHLRSAVRDKWNDRQSQ